MGVGTRLNAELCPSSAGPANLITDVPGVTVGQVTLVSGEGGHAVRTGVTAVVPPGDCFADKLPAAAYVSNGFGKSMGLMQVDELGSLETPILLTNTLSCGLCFEALVRHALRGHPEIGVTTSTVNPVVMECNDGSINDIRALSVTPQHGLDAIEAASTDFSEGAVGAGTGMTCFGLKGGVGSASRTVEVDGRRFVVGVLCLTNFGSLGCLRIAGVPVGSELARRARGTVSVESGRDRGSIVTVLATDLPADSRQLRRMARRVTVGIARCGGYVGNGSGEIVVAFSIANRIGHWAGEVRGRMLAQPAIGRVDRLSDNVMDGCFRAVAAASEDAIISSLLHGLTTTGRTGRPTVCLRDAARAAGIGLPTLE